LPAANKAAVAVWAAVFLAAGLALIAALPAVALLTKAQWVSMQADMGARLKKKIAIQKILKQQVQRLQQQQD
jgi:hypothetical protein